MSRVIKRYLQIAHVLSLAGSISSIIATVNSSVALCLEDGYDVTCVLMSLVQIMQDPFYRTFDGFRVHSCLTS